MDRDLLLGLDLGTTRSKAMLLDASGQEVAVAVTPTPFVTFDDGRIEMPVGDLLATVAVLAGKLAPWLERVAAAGIAGMAESGSPLDASGAPLAPIISWNDPRGGDVVEGLTERLGDSIALRTGQRPRPVSSIAKLGWLVAHGLAGADRWLGVPEMVLWNLTGRHATEHSLASRTGCYDVVRQCWLGDVAAAAGADISLFAEVLASGTTMGRVTAEAAVRLGLPGGIPVTLAGHDHLAGAVGAGAGPGDLVNSVGTAETVVGFIESAPDLGRALALRTPVSVAPGGKAWVVLAGAARAGVVLASAARLLGGSEQELDALADGASSGNGLEGRELLDRLSAGAPVDLDGQQPGAVWRELLEALSARTAEAAGRVATLAPARRMLVIGGGSGSRPWMRAKAQAVALPLFRPRTTQAAARGAALFAGQAAGWWASPREAPAVEADPVGA